MPLDHYLEATTILTQGDILAPVALTWRDELQGAVAVNLVVPMLEPSNPFSRLLEATEGPVRKVRVVLQCLEIYRPAGSDNWVEKLEVLTGRKLKPQKRGPKAKVEGNS